MDEELCKIMDCSKLNINTDRCQLNDLEVMFMGQNTFYSFICKIMKHQEHIHIKTDSFTFGNVENLSNVGSNT